jgi:hypothetical protein
MLPSEELIEVTWHLMNYEDQSSNNIPDSKLDTQTEIKVMNRPSDLHAIHRMIEAESHSVITALPFKALEGDPWQYQIQTAKHFLLPVPLLEVNDLRSSLVLNENSFIRVPDPPVSITRDSDWMIFSKDLVTETAIRSYSQYEENNISRIIFFDPTCGPTAWIDTGQHFQLTVPPVDKSNDEPFLLSHC